MTKEISEKEKTNPLVYILGIPVGILILVYAYNLWEKDKVKRECGRNIHHLDMPGYIQNGGRCIQLLKE